MEKKKYNPPMVEVISINNEDIIATSGDYHNYDKPGHGYGDTNHDHYGPPGQNKKEN